VHKYRHTLFGGLMAHRSNLTPRILIVDDSPNNLSLISDALRNQYHIKIANGGATAIELAVSNQPDIILLDIAMSGMDGFEICRRLKSEERTRRIPIILLAEKYSVQDEELGLSLGAVDFMHKPINVILLIARIKNHVAFKIWADYLQQKIHALERQLLIDQRKPWTMWTEHRKWPCINEDGYRNWHWLSIANYGDDAHVIIHA